MSKQIVFTPAKTKFKQDFAAGIKRSQADFEAGRVLTNNEVWSKIETIFAKHHHVVKVSNCLGGVR